MQPSLVCTFSYWAGLFYPKKKKSLTSSRQCVSLLEIAISLALLAILLSALLGFFTQSLKTKRKIEIAKIHAFSCQHLSTRLSQVFSAILPKEGLPEEATPFYTISTNSLETPCLLFIFNNGIDPDPAFSGPVKGKLFVDDSQRLCLTIQPLNGNAFHKEVLFRNIKSIHWEFLAKKDPHFSDKNAKAIDKTLEWSSLWPKEKGGIPSTIRLNLTEIVSEKERKTDNLSFAFFLPLEDLIATYTE